VEAVAELDLVARGAERAAIARVPVAQVLELIDARELTEPGPAPDRDRPAVNGRLTRGDELDLVVARAVAVPRTVREVEHEVELARASERPELRAVEPVDAGPFERGLDRASVDDGRARRANARRGQGPAVDAPATPARRWRDDDERHAAVGLRGQLARRALVVALGGSRRGQARGKQDGDD